MQTHNHLTGSRIVDSTEVIESNGVGFAWLDYHSQEGIDYAWWRSHDSRGNSEAADPHENGYSVIPVFA